jgi:hypothetical protein
MQIARCIKIEPYNRVSTVVVYRKQAAYGVGKVKRRYLPGVVAQKAARCTARVNVVSDDVAIGVDIRGAGPLPGGSPRSANIEKLKCATGKTNEPVLYVVLVDVFSRNLQAFIDS